MFLASAITVNLTTYYQEHIAFGVSMTVTFILAGLLSEIMSGTVNLTTYYQEHIAFGVSMTVTFILAGLLSEIMSGKGE